MVIKMVKAVLAANHGGLKKIEAENIVKGALGAKRKPPERLMLAGEK